MKPNIMTELLGKFLGECASITPEEQHQIQAELDANTKIKHKDSFFVGRLVESGTKKILQKSGLDVQDTGIPLWYDKSITLNGETYYLEDKKYTFGRKWFEFNLDNPTTPERTRGKINLTEAYAYAQMLDYIILSDLATSDDGIGVVPFAIINTKTMARFFRESMYGGFFYDHRDATEKVDYYGL